MKKSLNSLLFKNNNTQLQAGLHITARILLMKRTQIDRSSLSINPIMVMDKEIITKIMKILFPMKGKYQKIGIKELKYFKWNLSSNNKINKKSKLSQNKQKKNPVIQIETIKS